MRTGTGNFLQHRNLYLFISFSRAKKMETKNAVFLTLFAVVVVLTWVNYSSAQ